MTWPEAAAAAVLCICVAAVMIALLYFDSK